MNTRRIIFLSIFGLYQIIIFIMTVFMESKKSDLGFLFSMFEKINLFKYGAFIGVLLLAIEFAWVWKESKNKLQA